MTDPEDEFHVRMAQRVGMTLGKYTLKKLLGVGGMASVYEGVHRNGNRVAVKILHQQLCAIADVRGRFLREGYVANKVGHRGAVRVLDDDVAEDGSVLLVMELLEGETVEQRVLRAGGALDWNEAADIGRQLLEVLASAHKNGIVHRDIKPDNIFLDRETGSLKVLDFGIARLSEEGVQATRSGRLMGTPVYMAPEQARGMTRDIDGQTDVWAVGATLFRLLTGRYVFEAETPELVIVYAATQPARKIGSVLPQLPAAAATIIDRALVTDKKERWASADAMLQALRGGPSLPAVPRSDATVLPNTVAKSMVATPPPFTPSPMTPAPITPAQQKTLPFDPRVHGAESARPLSQPTPGEQPRSVPFSTMNNLSRTTSGGVRSGLSRNASIAIGAVAFVALALGAGLTVTAFKRSSAAATNATSSATSSAPKTGGIHAAATQTGVRLFIDGNDAGVLPRDVRDLTPGEHKLRFAGGPFHEALDRVVVVQPGEVLELGNVSLKVAKAELTVRLETPGARVIVARGATRREVHEATIPLLLDPADGWTVQATKEGFQELSEPVNFDDGNPQKTVTVKLTALAAPVRGTAPPATPLTPARATTRDCTNDRIDPKTDKVRPECVGK